MSYKSSPKYRNMIICPGEFRESAFDTSSLETPSERFRSIFTPGKSDATALKITSPIFEGFTPSSVIMKAAARNAEIAAVGCKYRVPPVLFCGSKAGYEVNI